MVTCIKFIWVHAYNLLKLYNVSKHICNLPMNLSWYFFLIEWTMSSCWLNVDSTVIRYYPSTTRKRESAIKDEEFLYLCLIDFRKRLFYTLICLFLQKTRLVIYPNCAKTLTLLPCYLNEKEIFLQIFTQLRSAMYLPFLLLFFPLRIFDYSAKRPVCQVNMYIFFFFNLDRNIYREMLFYSVYSYLNITDLKKKKIMCIFFFMKLKEVKLILIIFIDGFNVTC